MCSKYSDQDVDYDKLVEYELSCVKDDESDCDEKPFLENDITDDDSFDIVLEKISQAHEEFYKFCFDNANCDNNDEDDLKSSNISDSLDSRTIRILKSCNVKYEDFLMTLPKISSELDNEAELSTLVDLSKNTDDIPNNPTQAWISHENMLQQINTEKWKQYDSFYKKFTSRCDSARSVANKEMECLMSEEKKRREILQSNMDSELKFLDQQWRLEEAENKLKMMELEAEIAEEKRVMVKLQTDIKEVVNTKHTQAAIMIQKIFRKYRIRKRIGAQIDEVREKVRQRLFNKKLIILEEETKKKRAIELRKWKKEQDRKNAIKNSKGKVETPSMERNVDTNIDVIVSTGSFQQPTEYIEEIYDDDEDVVKASVICSQENNSNASASVIDDKSETNLRNVTELEPKLLIDVPKVVEDIIATDVSRLDDLSVNDECNSKLPGSESVEDYVCEPLEKGVSHAIQFENEEEVEVKLNESNPGDTGNDNLHFSMMESNQMLSNQIILNDVKVSSNHRPKNEEQIEITSNDSVSKVTEIVDMIVPILESDVEISKTQILSNQIILNDIKSEYPAKDLSHQNQQGNKDHVDVKSDVCSPRVTENVDLIIPVLYSDIVLPIDESKSHLKSELLIRTENTVIEECDVVHEETKVLSGPIDLNEKETNIEKYGTKDNKDEFEVLEEIKCDKDNRGDQVVNCGVAGLSVAIVNEPLNIICKEELEAKFTDDEEFEEKTKISQDYEKIKYLQDILMGNKTLIELCFEWMDYRSNIGDSQIVSERRMPIPTVPKHLNQNPDFTQLNTDLDLRTCKCFTVRDKSIVSIHGMKQLCPAIQSLTVNDTSLVCFHYDHCSNSLTYLDLERNKLEWAYFGSVVSSSLTIISCSSNELTQLPAGAFTRCDSLLHLDLSNNNFMSLENIFHHSEPLKSLCYLNLSGNVLSNIETLHYHCPTLTQLCLSNNHIRCWSSCANFPVLVDCDVSSNSLSKFEQLLNMPLLNKLDLSNNCLENVDAFSKSWLPCLSELFLDKNRLRTLPEFHFPLLQDISVTKNSIKDLLDVDFIFTNCPLISKIVISDYSPGIGMSSRKYRDIIISEQSQQLCKPSIPCPVGDFATRCYDFVDSVRTKSQILAKNLKLSSSVEMTHQHRYHFYRFIRDSVEDFSNWMISFLSNDGSADMECTSRTKEIVYDQKQTDAAIKIQAFWRGYRIRKWYKCVLKNISFETEKSFENFISSEFSDFDENYFLGDWDSHCQMDSDPKEAWIHSTGDNIASETKVKKVCAEDNDINPAIIETSFRSSSTGYKRTSNLGKKGLDIMKEWGFEDPNSAKWMMQRAKRFKNKSEKSVKREISVPKTVFDSHVTHSNRSQKTTQLEAVPLNMVTLQPPSSSQSHNADNKIYAWLNDSEPMARHKSFLPTIDNECVTIKTSLSSNRRDDSSVKLPPINSMISKR